MAHRSVIQKDEIYLASFNGTTGEVRREGRFRLVPGTFLLPQLTGLYPPSIAINDEGKSRESLTSRSYTGDTTAGLGIKYQSSGGDPGRFYWAYAETRYKRAVQLPPKKTVRHADAMAGVTPRAGIAYADLTWVAYDDEIYRYDGSAWTADHSLTGGAIPTADPLLWGDLMIWFLGADGIDWYDGTWHNEAQPATAGVVIGGILYIVTPSGLVKSTTDQTFVAAWTDEVQVGEQPSSMLAYINASNEVVPYVVGQRAIFAIDPVDNVAVQAGPIFAPSPWPLVATVLAADNRMYLAKGDTVLAWDGETTEPVGLDMDDGIPSQYRGGIKRLINGNLELYAIHDGELTAEGEDIEFQLGSPIDRAMGTVESYAVLYVRTDKGWHTVAMSTDDDSGQPVAAAAATALFISDAHDQYKLYFSWDNVLYAIDLRESFFNPSDDPDGQFEKYGEVLYPVTDFGLDNTMVGLMFELWTEGCYQNDDDDYCRVKPYIQYNEDGTWYELRNLDGSFGLTSNGRHQFDIHASPIPISAEGDPIEFNDEPATGHEFESVQIRVVMERGDDASDATTPQVRWVGGHALRSLFPAMGWTFNLDLSREYRNLSPQQQLDLLTLLIYDNAHGMLQFSYVDTLVDYPVSTVRAVKVTGFQGQQTTGQTHERKVTVRMTVQEVRTRDRSQ